MSLPLKRTLFFIFEVVGKDLHFWFDTQIDRDQCKSMGDKILQKWGMSSSDTFKILGPFYAFWMDGLVVFYSSFPVLRK